MKRVLSDFILPIVVLGIICLVCAGAVALTFRVTEPEILRMTAERAQAARLEVLPDADEFIDLDIDLPPGVTEALRAANGVGFVFQAQARGYAGQVPVMVGLDPEGRIIGVRPLANQETVGIGDRIDDPAWLALFIGLDNPDGVQGISGATVTVDALRNALRYAIAAFERVREVGA